MLRRLQELLSHSIPGGDVDRVLDYALTAGIDKVEKRRFAATSTPRRSPKRSSGNTRRLPAHVVRAVRERDGDRCTFVSESGHRCESRTRLEFDHVVPFALGGEATVEGIRLRCNTHNQFAADQVFGFGFMEAKRRGAQPQP